MNPHLIDFNVDSKTFKFWNFQFLVSMKWGSWETDGSQSYYHKIKAPHEDLMLCEIITKIDPEILLADENFMKIFNKRFFIYDTKKK